MEEKKIAGKNNRVRMILLVLILISAVFFLSWIVVFGGSDATITITVYGAAPQAQYNIWVDGSMAYKGTFNLQGFAVAIYTCHWGFPYEKTITVFAVSNGRTDSEDVTVWNGGSYSITLHV